MNPRLFLFVGLCAIARSTAQPADRQLAFAEDLYAHGEDVFALLEFKRFVFHNPSHAQAPLALHRLSRLYVSTTGNLAAAQETSAALIAKYPRSPLVPEARAFVEFLEVNSDFDGRPMQLWLKAESLEKQKRFDQAVAVLDRIVERFPQARLADDALYRIGTIQHERLGKTAEARATFARLAKAYPQSEWLVRAEFQAASALGSVKGSEREAAVALRRFAAKHPKDPLAKEALAKEALAKAAALERAGFVIKRQFDAKFVRKYALRRGGQAGQQYAVDIQIAAGLSQREVQATLEDALVKESAKRAKPQDNVRVQGYFNYPITRAGTATWIPGRAPIYRVEKRKTKHLLLDLGLDILNQP